MIAVAHIIRLFLLGSFLKKRFCDTKSIDWEVTYRSGNTLRFPRARAEPPRSQRTLTVGSHRLRFPAGVYVYFFR